MPYMVSLLVIDSADRSTDDVPGLAPLHTTPVVPVISILEGDLMLGLRSR